MSPTTCEQVRDLLPDWIHGALSPTDSREMEEHLAGCETCREEARLLESLLEGRPEAPAGLEAAITARLRVELGGSADLASIPQRAGGGKVIPLIGRRWPGVPLWALSAAALVVLSLGTGVIWNRWKGNGSEELPVVAVQESAPESWLWDDGMVAGAPVLDGLSEEDLETLLQEFGG